MVFKQDFFIRQLKNTMQSSKYSDCVVWIMQDGSNKYVNGFFEKKETVKDTLYDGTVTEDVYYFSFPFKKPFAVIEKIARIEYQQKKYLLDKRDDVFYGICRLKLKPENA